MVKLQGDFHFSFGTSTKRSEQPQGDFFARIAFQRPHKLLIVIPLEAADMHSVHCKYGIPFLAHLAM